MERTERGRGDCVQRVQRRERRGGIGVLLDDLGQDPQRLPVVAHPLEADRQREGCVERRRRIGVDRQVAGELLRGAERDAELAGLAARERDRAEQFEPGGRQPTPRGRRAQAVAGPECFGDRLAELPAPEQVDGEPDTGLGRSDLIACLRGDLTKLASGALRRHGIARRVRRREVDERADPTFDGAHGRVDVHRWSGIEDQAYAGLHHASAGAVLHMSCEMRRERSVSVVGLVCHTHQRTDRLPTAQRIF